MKAGWLVEHSIRQEIHDIVASGVIEGMETVVQRKWQQDMHGCWAVPTSSLQLGSAPANIKRFQLQLVTGSLAESQTNQRRHGALCTRVRTVACVFGCQNGEDTMSHYFCGSCSTANQLTQQIQQQVMAIIAQHIMVPVSVVAKYIKPWLPGYKQPGSPRVHGHRSLMWQV